MTDYRKYHHTSSKANHTPTPLPAMSGLLSTFSTSTFSGAKRPALVHDALLSPAPPHFEAAADAVVRGDMAALQRLLRHHHDLVRARSSRPHHATLLHYVSANGVEDIRQRTPPNAVAVATALLEAGAEVDASADTYGGGPQQTPLNLLVSSTHPARAGLQALLVDVLADFGAAVDGVENDESPLQTALAFHYPLAAERLVARGARVDTILTAAGLGRADLVDQFVGGDGELRAGVPLPPAAGLGLPHEGKAHVERALVWAAALGHANIVALLADRGVHLAASDNQGFTALHWAAFQGHRDVVDVLLERRAPLEVQNVYGGTVLGQTVWAAVHVDGVFHVGTFSRVDYAPIVERLLDAGARADGLQLPSGNAQLDAILARHGARPA